MKEEITVYKDGTNYYVAEDSALVRIARLDNCYSDNRVYDNSYFLMENEGKYYVYSIGSYDDFKKVEEPEYIYDELDEKYLPEVFFDDNSESAILYWDGSNWIIHFIEDIDVMELEYIDTIELNDRTCKYYKADENLLYCIENRNNLAVSNFYKIHISQVEHKINICLKNFNLE